MSLNSLTVLGSGSGLPQATRATSGYLLKTGESLSLIDCGGGVTSSFLRRGFDPLKVDRIFISHTHPDHVCELPLFFQLLYLKGRLEPIETFVPDEFVAPLNQYLNAVYLIKEKLPFEINIGCMSAGMVLNNPFKLSAVANDHLRGLADLIERTGLPNRMQCFSFIIEVDGCSVLYSSDIAGFDDVKQHIDGKDIVIIESTHVDLDEMFAFASTVKVGQFVITHLGTDEEIADIHQRAAKAGIENLTTAVDGLVLDL